MAGVKRKIVKPSLKLTRNSKFRGGGTNHAAKIIGPRGRKVSIPRTADSFKSKTDHT